MSHRTTKKVLVRSDGVSQAYHVSDVTPAPVDREAVQRAAQRQLPLRPHVSERVARASAFIQVNADPAGGSLGTHERPMTVSNARAQLRAAGQRAQGQNPLRDGPSDKAWRTTINGEPVIYLNGSMFIRCDDTELLNDLPELSPGLAARAPEIIDGAGGGRTVAIDGLGRTDNGEVVVADFDDASNSVAVYDPDLLRVAVAVTGADRLEVGEHREQWYPRRVSKQIGVLRNEDDEPVGWLVPHRVPASMPTD